MEHDLRCTLWVGGGANGGLRRMAVTSDVGVTGEERRREMRGEAGPNNPLNRSPNRVGFIDNLAVMTFCARPVNSGVMR